MAKSSVLYLNFEDDRLMPLDQKKFASLVDDFYRLYPENHERKTTLYDVHDAKTYQREIRALEAAQQELDTPGEIVTLDSYLRKGVT